MHVTAVVTRLSEASRFRVKEKIEELSLEFETTSACFSKTSQVLKYVILLSLVLQAGQSISSSLQRPAGKQLRENTPNPNDLRSLSRLVTQTN